MATRLKLIRTERGLTQKDLADKLGIPARTYGSWERGERDLSFVDACRIADILNCSLDELAGRTVNKLDHNEVAILERFRRLDRYGKAEVLDYADYQLSKREESDLREAYPLSEITGIA